jgi:hypothetical protein
MIFRAIIYVKPVALPSGYLFLPYFGNRFYRCPCITKYLCDLECTCLHPTHLEEARQLTNLGTPNFSSRWKSAGQDKGQATDKIDEASNFIVSSIIVSRSSPFLQTRSPNACITQYGFKVSSLYSAVPNACRECRERRHRQIARYPRL